MVQNRDYFQGTMVQKNLLAYVFDVIWVTSFQVVMSVGKNFHSMLNVE